MTKTLTQKLPTSQKNFLNLFCDVKLGNPLFSVKHLG